MKFFRILKDFLIKFFERVFGNSWKFSGISERFLRSFRDSLFRWKHNFRELRKILEDSSEVFAIPNSKIITFPHIDFSEIFRFSEGIAAIERVGELLTPIECTRSSVLIDCDNFQLISTNFTNFNKIWQNYGSTFVPRIWSFFHHQDTDS